MIRSFLSRPRLFLAAALIAAPCVVHADDALAHMGSVDLKVDDVRPTLDALTPEQRSSLSGNPKALDQAIRTLLVQHVVLQEAQAKGWEKQPEFVAQLARIHDSAMIESYLQSVSKTPDGYPSDAEVKAAYDNAKANLIVPKQYHLAQIFVACPQGADADKAQAKVDAVQKSLAQSGSDFGAIARIQSDDRASGSRGGEIGWVTEAQIQPELKSKVTTLSKGAVSAPIKLNDGWHILKLSETKESYTASLDEIKPQIVQRLRAAKSQELRQAYLAKLVQANPPTINEIALAKAVNPSAK